MKQKDREQLIAGLLSGKLKGAKAAEALRDLKASGMDTEEIEELMNLSAGLELLPEPEVPDSLNRNFYAMLEAEEAKAGRKSVPQTQGRSLHMSPIWQLAAGIALFIMGWAGSAWLQSGNTQQELLAVNQEVTEMKKMVMLTLLDQTSANSRMQGVQMVSQISQPDQQVITALLKTLNTDPSDNVRLVALESLTPYTHLPEVREGLIRSISRQDSPVMQMALADLMVSLNEKEAVEPLQELQQNKGLNYMVAGKIENSLKVLL